MRQHGVRAKGKKWFKVPSDSNHDLPIAPNLLNRQLTVAKPDRIGVGDLTWIDIDEGWLCVAVAVAIDLHSRQVVGWSMRAGHDARHRDRRAAYGMVQASSLEPKQYASKDFRVELKDYGIAASMSRRGNCRGQCLQ